jgi:uncharacterized protein (UPF0248 family)
MPAGKTMQKEKCKDLEKEVMEKDALNRILWDPSLKPEEYDIYYIDRFRDNLSRVNFSSITVEGDFFKHGDSMIPMHRIRRITCRSDVVWEKKAYLGTPS